MVIRGKSRTQFAVRDLIFVEINAFDRQVRGAHIDVHIQIRHGAASRKVVAAERRQDVNVLNYVERIRRGNGITARIGGALQPFFDIQIFCLIRYDQVYGRIGDGFAVFYDFAESVGPVIGNVVRRGHFKFDDSGIDFGKCLSGY